MPNRSAKDGKYVTDEYAKKHPNTTVKEAPPKKPSSRPKGGSKKK